MKKAWIYLLIICILNSILLYNQSFGLNVVIFTIPFLIFLIMYLNSNNLIKNKKGLLFAIPILILSSNYLIYNNIFSELNILAIPIMYLLLFIYTTNPTQNLFELLEKGIILVFKPLAYIENLYKVISISTKSFVKMSDNLKKKLKSFLIVIPIVIIVLLLLSSADMVFDSYFKSFFTPFDSISIDNILGRTISLILLFTYTGATLIYLLNVEKTESKNLKIEGYTIKLLLTILNVIYIIFDIIQIRSLLLHHVGTTISYAEYARTGFFQLMFISLINLIIILLSKCSKETRYNKVMSLLMVFLTLIIIFSSFMRMYLYESTYGYTILRLGVYIILFTEVLLLIPTVIYILNSKHKVLYSYLTIVTIIYTIINLFSIDNIITKNNINRYYKKNDIDIEYLENYNYDNIPLLVDFYNNCEDEKIRYDLKRYFTAMHATTSIDMDNIFEYNMSKNKAKKYLDTKK